jgi:transposase InsO family protein
MSYANVKKLGTLSSVRNYAHAYRYPINVAKKKLMGEIAHSLYKPARKRFPRRPVCGLFLGDLLCSDICYVDSEPFLPAENGGNKYLLVVMDTLSRYVWVEALKDKSSKLVAQIFDRILRRIPYRKRSLLTDKGTEFSGAPCQKVLQKHGIRHFKSQSDKHNPVCERMIRTLKLRIARYLLANNTSKFVSKLPLITRQINSSVHRITKMAPKDVTPDNESLALMRSVSHSLKNNTAAVYKVGDHVRLSLDKLGTFSKESRGTFTDGVFVVDKVDVHLFPPVYFVKDLNGDKVEGFLYKEELTKVDPPTKYRIQVLRTRTRNGKKEYFVKWLGYPESENSWIGQNQLV